MYSTQSTGFYPQSTISTMGAEPYPKSSYGTVYDKYDYRNPSNAYQSKIDLIRHEQDTKLHNVGNLYTGDTTRLQYHSKVYQQEPDKLISKLNHDSQFYYEKAREYNLENDVLYQKGYEADQYSKLLRDKIEDEKKYEH